MVVYFHSSFFLHVCGWGGLFLLGYVASGVAFPDAIPWRHNNAAPFNYIGFVTNLMFWIGLIFETPLVMFLLTKLHIVTPKLLLKGWRIAVIASAVLAATITPTVDPVNMALLMGPMLGLYLLSVLMSVFAQ